MWVSAAHSLLKLISQSFLYSQLTINNSDILNCFGIAAHRLYDVVSVLVPTNAVPEFNIAESRNVFRISTLNNGMIPADSVENVIHGHGEAFLLDADHEDVLQIDVLHNSAAAHGALEADADVGIDKGAVFHEDIVDAAGHFTTDDKSAVAHADFAVVDVYIFTGL